VRGFLLNAESSVTMHAVGDPCSIRRTIRSMGFAEQFAETSVKGAITRAAVAWVLITPAIAAAKIWWSATAAVVVFLVGVGIYVVVAVRFRRRHRQPSAT
jgi:hypothetical protein